MRVWTSVNVDEQRVLVTLVEVVWKIEPDFSVVFAPVDLDVQVRDLKETDITKTGHNFTKVLKQLDFVGGFKS